MTYISPRVAIWNLFCVSRHYIRYIIIVAHGKSCARACVPPVNRWPSSSLRGSSHFPLLFTSAVSLYRSRYDVLRCSFAILSLSLSFSPRCAPSALSSLPASCATVNHSACDCVRLITVIRLFPGSGISTANYNHRFFSYVTSLFSCGFVRFSADVCTTTKRRIPVADRGKAYHSSAYAP